MSTTNIRSNKLYAVVSGRHPGIYNTWQECKAETVRFPGARFKSFYSREEAHQYIIDGELTTEYKSAKRIHGAKSHNAVIKRANVYAASNCMSYVYTDGACSNNGRLNSRAGYGVWFGKDDPRNESCRLSGKQTNNTAEVIAILKACDTITRDLVNNPNSEWVIVTDSMYALRYATTLGDKHYGEGWARDIPNKDLVRKLHRCVSSDSRIKMMKIAAHTGHTDAHSLGNVQADRLATSSIGEK